MNNTTQGAQLQKALQCVETFAALSPQQRRATVCYAVSLTADSHQDPAPEVEHSEGGGQEP